MLDFVFPYSDRLYLDASDLQTFFEQFDWCEGLYTADEFDESVLNEYEKANRDLIVEYESEMGF